MYILLGVCNNVIKRQMWSQGWIQKIQKGAAQTLPKLYKKMIQNFIDRGVAVVHSANPLIRPWVHLTW